MKLREWTRSDLISFVEGTRVMMRGAEAQDLAVPEWLVAHADDVGAKDSTESVDTTHPDDRGALIESFIASVQSPGEPCSCRIRNEEPDGWYLLDVTWVNLLDHPDVEGILCVVTQVGELDVELASELSGAESSATNWMILRLDDQGAVLGGRGAANEILGHEIDELIGHNAIDFLHPDGMASAIENWIALRTHPGQTRTARQLWLHRDGSPVWLEASFLLDADGTAEMVVVDIRDRMANEQALVASQAEVASLAADFRLVADEVPTPVFRCDAEGRIDFRNSQWAESFPCGGSDGGWLHDVFEPDARSSIDELLAGDGEESTRVIEAGAADGERVLSLRLRRVGEDEHRFVGSIADITATVLLRHEATHDGLTGLANRSRIINELGAAMDADASGVLVVFIDLDAFKGVNDRCGHDVGDLVLVEIASRLASAVRPGDLVGRHGGDEFVVVCTGVAEADSRMIVERLRAGAFSRPVVLPEGEWPAAASIGYARPQPGDDVARVLRRADEAMFAEKRRAQGL